MRDPRLCPFDVKTSYSSQLLPKLKYTLVTCAASEEQLRKIHQGVMGTYKHALKLPITATDAKMRIPHAYGGYGLESLHIEMTSVQAIFAVQHLRNGDSVGRRIRILLEHHQMETGLSTSILEASGRPE